MSEKKSWLDALNVVVLFITVLVGGSGIWAYIDWRKNSLVVSSKDFKTDDFYPGVYPIRTTRDAELHLAAMAYYVVHLPGYYENSTYVKEGIAPEKMSRLELKLLINGEEQNCTEYLYFENERQDNVNTPIPYVPGGGRVIKYLINCSVNIDKEKTYLLEVRPFFDGQCQSHNKDGKRLSSGVDDCIVKGVSGSYSVIEKSDFKSLFF